MFGTYGSLSLFTGDIFQDPQWMSKSTDSTEPFMYYVFSYTHIPMICDYQRVVYTVWISWTKGRVRQCEIS